MGWVNDFVELVNSIGFTTVLQSVIILMLFVMIYGCYRGLKSDIFWDMLAQKITDKSNKNHSEHELRGQAARINVNLMVSKLLTKLLYEVDADRVTVLELHNGKENPGGLPFLFIDMQYEETKEGVPSVMDEYENVSLSKFPISSFIYNERFYIGKVSDLYSIDKKFVHLIKSNDVSYIGLIIIQTDKELGFLEVSFKNEPTLSRDKIHAKLGDYVQQIGKLLDYENYDK